MASVPSSLTDKCLDVIAANFDWFLNVLESSGKRAEKHLLQLNFSDTLLEKLEGTLQKRHASFLINPYLRTLNLDRFSVDDLDETIDILETEGKAITTLHLSEHGQSKYSESILLRLARSLPEKLKSFQLISFNPEGTEFSDEVLKIVVETCLELEELKLFNCQNVTDEGIETLFSNSDGHINRTLAKIDLRGCCSITSNSVVMILRRCKNLTEFLHYNLGAALFYIYEHIIKRNISHFSTYKLETLDLQPQGLKAALVMCPEAKFLIVTDLTTQDQINSCGDFEKLNTVVFQSTETLSASQFFKTRGSHLENVILLGNIVVSIQSVIQFCSNIRHLILHGTKFDQASGRSRFGAAEGLLQNLKVLEIKHVNLTVDAAHIRTLFCSCPNIENVTFENVSGFSSEFVDSILLNNPACLYYVNIFNSNVYASAVEKLIVSIPNLKRIVARACGTFSQSECEKLKSWEKGLSIYCESL